MIEWSIARDTDTDTDTDRMQLSTWKTHKANSQKLLKHCLQNVIDRRPAEHSAQWRSYS